MTAIVAFVSQKGGVGKSTLARALASVAAHGGLRVLLADIDPQQQTSLLWQARRVESKLSPRLSVEGFDSPQDVIASAGSHDLVVIDTPGQVSEDTLAIARMAHLVVVPTGAGIDDLHPTVLLLHELAGAGIPKVRVTAALCRILIEDEEIAARSYIEEAGYEVLAGSIPEHADYRLAHNRGEALTEARDRSLNRRADQLMEALLVKMGSITQVGTVGKIGKRKEK